MLGDGAPSREEFPVARVGTACGSGGPGVCRDYTDAMLTARRYLVSGRVQGVGFRFYVLEAAESEGISGSVKNLPDGRVEVIAEGEREAVDRFEGRIRRGPPAARVEDIGRTDEVPSGRVTGFRIA